LVTYSCPACWQEISEGETYCPFCGFELSRFQALTYEQKLVLSLDHPVQERRMMAIKILGDLTSQAALPAFERLLQKPQADVYELRETLVALSKIQGPRSQEVVRNALQHPYPVIRCLADKLLLSWPT